MANQVGIVDADYYNNESNEGHIFVKLENTGDKVFPIKIGDRVAQGIFIKYFTVTDEEDVTEERRGGFGSTGGK
jgi:dUTP pyrophosphatase